MTAARVSFIAILVFSSTCGWGQVRVTSANKVGIGITNPVEKMEVNGNLKLLSSNKLMLGDANRYLGKAGTAGDLALISKLNNYWLRIGSQGGLALWGGVGAEAQTDPHVFLTTSGGLGINTMGTGTHKLSVTGTCLSTGGWSTSDARYKADILPIPGALDKILRLDGRQYRLRKDEFDGYESYGDLAYGFIAQEVDSVVPEAVRREENGFLSVNYDMIIPLLVEALKAQEDRIRLLETLLGAKSSYVVDSVNGKRVSARLDQARPNPTTESTVIAYFTDETLVGKLELVLYDASGREWRRWDGLSRGEQTLEISLAGLSAGEYLYSLLLDQEVLMSRVVVLVR